MDEDRDGWWDVGPRARWTCPACGETSPVGEWRETEVGCEDCGSHDGRECPRCGEAFDHVWGAEQVEAASAKAG